MIKLNANAISTRLPSYLLFANPPNQRDNLETRRDHLGFTVVLDTQHVDSEERDAENGDPDGGVEI